MNVSMNESRDYECKLGMEGLDKYLQRVAMPRSDDIGLGKALTKEVNSAVQRVLENRMVMPW